MKPDPREEVLGITRRKKAREPTTRSLGNNGHAITTTAWRALNNHYQRPDLDTFLLAAITPLAPIAHAANRCNRILCTNYDFTAKTDRHVLWYRPNPYGGITIQLPDE